jgi:Bacterial Ig-like domain (group 2)
MGAGSYSLSWRSSNPSVLSVNAQTGALRAAGAGTAWLVATAGNARDSVRVTVAAAVAAVAPVSAVDITDADFSIEAGASPRTLRATVVDSNGRRVARAIAWTSTNSAVATVDAAGRVTPVAQGTARITAAADGFSDQVTVSVSAAAPALPAQGEVRSAVEGYVAALAGGNREAVTRYWGSAATGPRDDLLSLMGERNFVPTLGTVGEAAPEGAGAVVSFQVAAAYRTNFGQNRSRDLRFSARLERVGSQWQIASCVLQ